MAGIRAGHRHFGKTFISVSVLDVLKSGSFIIEVRADAMVDAYGYVSLPMSCCREAI